VIIVPSPFIAIRVDDTVIQQRDLLDHEYGEPIFVILSATTIVCASFSIMVDYEDVWAPLVEEDTACIWRSEHGSGSPGRNDGRRVSQT